MGGGSKNITAYSNILFLTSRYNTDTFRDCISIALGVIQSLLGFSLQIISCRLFNLCLVSKRSSLGTKRRGRLVGGGEPGFNGLNAIHPSQVNTFMTLNHTMPHNRNLLLVFYLSNEYERLGVVCLFFFSLSLRVFFSLLCYQLLRNQGALKLFYYNLASVSIDYLYLVKDYTSRCRIRKEREACSIDKISVNFEINWKEN